MILLQSESKFLLQILQSRAVNNTEKSLDIDCQAVEFDDVRYHIQKVRRESVDPTCIIVNSMFEVKRYTHDQVIGCDCEQQGLYKLVQSPSDGTYIVPTGSISPYLWHLRFDHLPLHKLCHVLHRFPRALPSSFSVKRPQFLFISLSIPAQGQEAAYFGALPLGAVEAVKAIYGPVVQMLDPPKDGYDITLKLNLSKLPSDEEQKLALFEKIASVREVVLGAPLRVVLKHLALKTVAPNINEVMTLVYRPRELFFIFPQTDKVTIVYPMRFKDPIDIILGTSFLQEFVEARSSAGFTNSPSCSWSHFPPPELEGAPSQALEANAGFFTFVISPRHVEGSKLDKTVWSLLTFHAYVSYHVKFSESFMHTRMRRRVETLIQALDQAKTDTENSKKI